MASAGSKDSRGRTDQTDGDCSDQEGNATKFQDDSGSDKQGFFVITRRIDQGIIIDNDIQVTINKITKRAVSIAIKAPKSRKIVKKDGI